MSGLLPSGLLSRLSRALWGSSATTMTRQHEQLAAILDSEEAEAQPEPEVAEDAQQRLYGARAGQGLSGAIWGGARMEAGAQLPLAAAAARCRLPPVGRTTVRSHLPTAPQRSTPAACAPRQMRRPTRGA